MMKLFTPSYILHRLADMVDRGDLDQRIAQKARYLRPRLTMGEFRRRDTNHSLAGGVGR